MSKDSRCEQRMASIALRHVEPEHVPGVLTHYAESLQKGIDDGRVTGRDVDLMPWHQHDAGMASIAKDNPHVRRKVAEAASERPSAQRREGPYQKQVQAAIDAVKKGRK